VGWNPSSPAAYMDRAPLLQDERRWHRIGGRNGGGWGLDRREEIWGGEEEDLRYRGENERIGSSLAAVSSRRGPRC
jgi:hypothetical protein